MAKDFISDDEMNEIKPEVPDFIPDDKMSAIEAAQVGGLEGAGWGFADEVRGAIASPLGALKTVGEKFGMNFDKEVDGVPLVDEDIAAYKMPRDNIRYLNEKAAQDQPASYYGSMIGAGALTGGAASKIPQLAKLGKAALPLAGFAGGVAVSESDNIGGDIASGAVGAALPVAMRYGTQKAAKLGKFLTGKLGKSAPVQEGAERVVDAGKRLVGPDFEVPGQMLTKDPTISSLASDLQSSPSIGGGKVREAMAPVYEAVESTAKGLASEADGTAFSVGKGLKTGFKNAFSAKTAPAEAVYEGIEASYSKAPIDGLAWKRGINRLHREVGKFDPTGKSQAMLENVNRTFSEGINTVGDIRKFRTQIGRFLGPDATDAERSIMGDLYGILTRERNRSILAAGAKGTSKIGRSDRAMRDLKDLVGADRLYAGALKETGEALGVTGSKAKNLRGQVNRYLEDIPAEKLVKQAFDKNDVGRMRLIQSKFPEQFEALRKLEIQKLVTGSSKDGQLNPRRLATNLQKYSPEMQELIFGNKAKSATDMVDLLSGIPEQLNPSGTSIRQEYSKSIFNPKHQAESFAKEKYLNRITPKVDAAGKIIEQKHPGFKKTANFFGGVENHAGKFGFGGALLTNAGQRASYEGSNPSNVKDVLPKVAGTKYGTQLQDALSRGGESAYAATYYLLSRDENFRELLAQ